MAFTIRLNVRFVVAFISHPKEDDDYEHSEEDPE